MKFLGYSHSHEESHRICSLLRSKGIPTYRKSTVLAFMPYREALYCCVDSQYQDARALLNNPNHVVASPIDVDAYELLAERLDPDLLLRRGVLVMAIVAVLVFLGLYFSGIPWFKAAPN